MQSAGLWFGKRLGLIPDAQVLRGACSRFVAAAPAANEFITSKLARRTRPSAGRSTLPEDLIHAHGDNEHRQRDEEDRHRPLEEDVWPAGRQQQSLA